MIPILMSVKTSECFYRNPATFIVQQAICEKNACANTASQKIQKLFPVIQDTSTYNTLVCSCGLEVNHTNFVTMSSLPCRLFMKSVKRGTIRKTIDITSVV